MRLFSAAAVLVLATATTAEAHASSVSYADFSVDARGIHAIIRLPMDDVDLLLRIDRDLDGRISTEELDAAKPAIAAYAAKHLRVSINSAPLPQTLDTLATWRDAAAFQYVEGVVSYPPASGLLSIRSDFLTELYPSHKTLGHVRVDGQEDRFTFDSTATYERRLVSERATMAAAVVAALAILALLWRTRRRSAAMVALIVVAAPARADVIMSAPALNATLKTMERLQRESASQKVDERTEALFRLGAEADSLASLMNREVESHGMQERELLDLALSRTKELGIGIAYHRDKKTFFYDGAAFLDYLKAAPRGARAAAAEFTLLSYQFYQSPATDIRSLTAAAEAKQRFLARHPTFESNAAMRLYLAVDYRDLGLRYDEAQDAASAAKYKRLARAECERIVRQYPRSEQAGAARQMLRSALGR